MHSTMSNAGSMQAVWPEKNRQMSIKLAQNDFTRKMIDFDTLKKLPKNVRNLGKWIVAKGFKKLPKVQKIASSSHTDSRGFNAHSH